MLSILSGNILHLCCQQLGRHQLFFQFPDEVRRILYTTNVIEWLIRQYRKVTKTKSVSPVTAYWKRCSIWQARMWQRNGPSAIAARIRSSASWPCSTESGWHNICKIIRKGWGQGTMERCHCSQPYSVGIYSIDGRPHLIPEPTKKSRRMVYFWCQNKDCSIKP